MKNIVEFAGQGVNYWSCLLFLFKQPEGEQLIASTIEYVLAEACNMNASHIEILHSAFTSLKESKSFQNAHFAPVSMPLIFITQATLFRYFLIHNGLDEDTFMESVDVVLGYSQGFCNALLSVHSDTNHYSTNMKSIALLLFVIGSTLHQSDVSMIRISGDQLAVDKLQQDAENHKCKTSIINSDCSVTFSGNGLIIEQFKLYLGAKYPNASIKQVSRVTAPFHCADEESIQTIIRATTLLNISYKWKNAQSVKGRIINNVDGSIYTPSSNSTRDIISMICANIMNWKSVCDNTKLLQDWNGHVLQFGPCVMESLLKSQGRLHLMSQSVLMLVQPTELLDDFNAIRKRIKCIWEEHFDSTNNGFFESGGDSLIASEICNKINAMLGVKSFEGITTDMFLDTESTVFSLIQKAKVIFDGRMSHSVESQYQMNDDNQEHTTINQRSLMTLSMINQPSFLSYIVPVSVDLHPRARPEEYKRICEALFEENRILRSRMAGPTLEYTAQFSWTEINTNEEKQSLLEEIARTPLDTSKSLVEFYLLLLNGLPWKLAMKFHHIIIDGRSIMSIAEHIRKKRSCLSPVMKTFFEYAKFEQILLNSSHYQQGKCFWDKYLHNVELLNWYPTDKMRPNNSLYPGDQWVGIITPDEGSQLRELSTKHKTTFFIQMMSACMILLSMHSNHRDILIGTVLTNRPETGFQESIGYFANSLPIRITIHPDNCYTELIAKVNQLWAQCQKYQSIPFNNIMSEVKPGGWTSTPQIMFAMQEIWNRNGDHKTEILFNGRAKFDISFELWPQEDNSVHVKIEYRSDLFLKGNIERLGQRYLSLLKKLMTIEPECRISDLMTSIVNGENGTDVSRSKNNFTAVSKTHPLELFKTICDKRSDHIAIRNDIGDAITYENMWRKVNMLAKCIKEIPGTIAGFYMNKTIECILLILGTMLAGKIYVPLDICNPINRIKMMIEDANIDFIITNQDHQHQFEEFTTVVLTHDIFAGEITEMVDHLSCLKTEDPAYIIFTSGSTGKPKGVLIKQYQLQDLVLGQIDCFEMGSDDVVLLFAPLGFDASISEIFVTLLSGATLAVVEGETQLNELPMVVERMDVSMMTIPPSVFALHKQIHILPKLKKIIFAGEALKPTILPQQSNVSFFNAYGPTECTVCATCYKLDLSQLDRTMISVPIGKPIRNTHVFLVDEFMNQVPKGIKGEICVMSPRVTCGYINHNDGNSAIDCSMSTNERIYKTGDVGVMTDDNNFIFVERLNQTRTVKLYGSIRVALEEVEAVYHSYPQVKQAVVLENNGRMHAFIVKASDFCFQSFDKHIRGYLPPYMIPHQTHVRDSIPLTVNNKIDSRQLLDTINLREEISELDHNNTTISKVVQLLEEIVKIPILKNYRVLDLGIRSIEIVELLLLLRKTFPYTDIAAADLYNNPHISDIAELLEMSSDSDSQFKHDLALTPILEKAVIEDLIPVQQRKHILLTGATGYLGCHVLSRLLNTYPDVVIYCLVRSKSTDEALSRIKLKCHNYGLSKTIDFSRLEVILCDLESSSCGLSSIDYDFICRKIDAIYHTVALMNFNASYNYLRKTNVLSTVSLLEIAVTCKLKHFYYVSSMSVFLFPDRKITVDETTISDPKHLLGGYAQTKFVSENIIMSMFHKGVPCSIFRIARIAAPSNLPLKGELDLLTLLIRGCYEAQCFPDLDFPIDLTCVDIIADSISHLSQVNSPLINHIVNPSTMSFRDMVMQINRRYNSLLPIVTFEEWKAKITRSNCLFPLTPFLFMNSFLEKGGQYWPVFDCSRTIQLLPNFLIVHEHLTIDVLLNNVLELLDSLEVTPTLCGSNVFDLHDSQ